jgi:hypothetical protein
MLTGQSGKPLSTRPHTESMARIAVFLVVIGATLAAGPADAQFGNVFNNGPPRPPGDVPNGPFPAQPPPVGYPGQAQPQYQPPPQPQPAPRQPAGIQAQPLPPPPGASNAPASQAPRVAPPSPATQGARNAPGPAPANSPPPPRPDDASLRPDDTVVTETPTQKIENGRAVFSGLDKITGRIISFDAAIGETVQFGALQVTARACYTRPPTEATNTDAFVEVDEVTLQGEIKRIFNGWMFAASPGLHAVEHPIYDVWLTDCAQPKQMQVAQPAPAPAAAPPAAARPPRQPPRPQTPPGMPAQPR